MNNRSPQSGDDANLLDELMLNDTFTTEIKRLFVHYLRAASVDENGEAILVDIGTYVEGKNSQVYSTIREGHVDIISFESENYTISTVESNETGDGKCLLERRYGYNNIITDFKIMIDTGIYECIPMNYGNGGYFFVRKLGEDDSIECTFWINYDEGNNFWRNVCGNVFKYHGEYRDFYQNYNYIHDKESTNSGKYKGDYQVANKVIAIDGVKNRIMYENGEVVYESLYKDNGDLLYVKAAGVVTNFKNEDIHNMNAKKHIDVISETVKNINIVN